MLFSLKLSRIGIFILVVLGGLACTTQKRKGDVSKLKKGYHNTTSYYNAYFNADLLIDESIITLEGQHKDNYNQILPMYKYTAADNPQAVYPGLDKAIEKLVTTVHLHRVADWTDDCYLQIGRSQYLKQDFESAEETLEYFIQEFNEEGQSKSLAKSAKKGRKPTTRTSSGSATKTSKSKEKENKKLIQERKKQINKQKSGKKVSAKDAKAIREARKQAQEAEKTKEINTEKQTESPLASTESDENGINKTLGGQEHKPKSYFMKHKPCYQEGLVWLARTYIERQNYDNARMYIKQLENDPYTFKDVRAHCAAVDAYSHLKQKNYNLAVIPLRKAIELSSDKREKARFTFILGQLLEQTGNFAEASTAYDRALKYHYSPEMDFYARLRSVICQSRAVVGNQQSIVRELERMIKERKYAEYRDQLYYSMGMTNLQAGDTAKGIEQLELALKQTNASRQNQVEIYYTLANLYYDQEKYVLAKKNFDSAINVMSKTDERKPQCERISRSISEIASNIATIEQQDSLLNIAGMSDDEKMELAKKIKQEKELAQQKENEPDPASKPSGSGTFYSAGSRPLFFAYDQKNSKRNQREFEKKWGTRPLEDDWRRANKAANAFAENESTEEGSSTGASRSKMTTMEMQEILRDVPASPGAMTEANDKIQQALFNLGGLFRDKLERADKSLLYLQQLEKRYPAHHQEADAFYIMYLDYLDLGNLAMADSYRQRIISSYPESIYATVLNDPNYFKKKKEEENKLNTYYASTYDHYSKGNYQKAYQMASESNNLFGNNNQLRSKFALINALSVGNLKGVDEYMQALREVVAKYPNTEEQTRAREILRLLGQRVGAETGKTEDVSASVPQMAGNELYKNEPEEQHFIIIVLNGAGFSLDNAKIKASDFNRIYFSLDQLKVSNIVIGENNQTPVVVVRRFNNQTSAMKYYDAIIKNRKDFNDDVTQYEVFAISQNNYRALVANRSAETYREFFIQNYLK